MSKKTLTTYEIAEHCQVTPRTAIQWVIEGKLKAYRTPGNHSRVSIENFIDFLNRYKMPVPQEFATSRGSGKKRILIVDDDRVMVGAVGQLLAKEKKYDLDTAYDGFEAGEKFASFKPDLILLDIMMPGLDGFKVCSRIRKNPNNEKVKIFFISAAINEHVIEEIKKSGANDYMAKPFDTKELKIKIKNLLDVPYEVLKV